MESIKKKLLSGTDPMPLHCQARLFLRKRALTPARLGFDTVSRKAFSLRPSSPRRFFGVTLNILIDRKLLPDLSFLQKVFLLGQLSIFKIVIELTRLLFHFYANILFGGIIVGCFRPHVSIYRVP